MTKIGKKNQFKELADFKGQTINLGLDVHKKNWNVSVYLNQQFIRSFHQAPDGKVLLSHLKANYPNGIYRACYEAGFCGFSIQRELAELGIACSVVNATDVPQTNKGMLSKTDTIDSRRIGEAFAKDMLTPIYIPSPDIEADRNLIRYRKKVQEGLRSKKQGVKSCLHILGLKIPAQYDKPYWTNTFITWLKGLEIENPSTKITLNFLIDDVLLLRKRLFATNRDIRKLSQSDKYKEEFNILTSTPGIGLITAMTMITEIGDINRFKNFSQFNSFIGFCPSEFSSGEHIHKGKMTPRGHKTIRALLIEAAWIAVRCDPALVLKYHELKKVKTSKRAIVVIARKLLSKIYTIWRTKEQYKKGIIEK
jgi:transposase